MAKIADRVNIAKSLSCSYDEALQVADFVAKTDPENVTYTLLLTDQPTGGNAQKGVYKLRCAQRRNVPNNDVFEINCGVLLGYWRESPEKAAAFFKQESLPYLANTTEENPE